MPASYPTSVKTFAARSNGAVIDASHVQDLQDEVTAIESGLLNGTAPLNSSNSTMVNLTVTSSATLNILKVSGASSLAGTLSVTGNSTFAGSVHFTGAVTGLNPPRVRLSHGSTQTLSTSAFTGLNWNTEIYDSAAMHSTAVNSSRITCAGSTGIYHVGAQVTVSTLATGSVLARILMNDSSECLALRVEAAGSVPTPVNLSGDVRIAELTDYLTLQVRAVNSTGSVLAESSNTALGFWAHWISS